MSVKENIDTVKSEIYKAALSAGRDPGDIDIVAVSKGVSPEDIQQAIDAGIDIVAENRVQEFVDKYDKLDKKIRWHFIGSLQTNKVKYIIDKTELIHSLDRVSLARMLNKRGKAINRRVQALVQVNITKETSKSGVYEEDLPKFLEEVSMYPFLKVKGLMTIGPHTDDSILIRACFNRCREIFERLQSEKLDHIDMEYLSMGMSSDYMIAVEEGANIVRIGRAIFNKKAI
ncbi:MAG: YggS family pyridoxal phosphate-dependent enzyme [Clostridiales bacterium]|nr:YggS family pyridoxal phosphate-dependent enzyme [Clostridiales bacterium]